MEHNGHERQNFASHWSNISPLMERAGYVPAASENKACRSDMLRPKPDPAHLNDVTDGRFDMFCFAALIDRIANHSDVVGHTPDGNVMLSVDLPHELFDALAAFDPNGDPDVESNLADSPGDDLEGETAEDLEPDVEGPEVPFLIDQTERTRGGNLIAGAPVLSPIVRR